jgi:hypothetical protein
VPEDRLIDISVGTAVTVSVAAVLVTAGPAALLTTTVKVDPLSASTVGVVV